MIFGKGGKKEKHAQKARIIFLFCFCFEKDE